MECICLCCCEFIRTNPKVGTCICLNVLGSVLLAHWFLAGAGNSSSLSAILGYIGIVMVIAPFLIFAILDMIGRENKKKPQHTRSEYDTENDSFESVRFPIPQDPSIDSASILDEIYFDELESGVNS